MVRISKVWLDSNTDCVIDPSNGSRIKRHILKNINVPDGGFETSLSGEQKEQIDCGLKSEEFKINVPGIGWCKADTYPATARCGIPQKPRSSYKFKK